MNKHVDVFISSSFIVVGDIGNNYFVLFSNTKLIHDGIRKGNDNYSRTDLN